MHKEALLYFEQSKTQSIFNIKVLQYSQFVLGFQSLKCVLSGPLKNVC